jgi:23S rRNA (uracil1939-C5)-methyltransferase
VLLRVLVEPGAADRERLVAFSARENIWFHLQAAGPDSIRPLLPDTPELAYRLPAHDVELRFGPSDFIQANAVVNEAMVDQALGLLEVAGGDNVLELYAGLGNFTLPLARRAAQVTAVEGDAALLGRARANARLNGIENVAYHAADLDAPDAGAGWLRRRYERVLLDPPRTGARAVMPLVAALRPTRLVYVSCHPGTLARDAGLLVHGHGYRLLAAGIMDMFPHTSHVESMALFEAG